MILPGVPWLRIIEAKQNMTENHQNRPKYTVNSYLLNKIFILTQDLPLPLVLVKTVFTDYIIDSYGEDVLIYF